MNYGKWIITLLVSLPAAGGQAAISSTVLPEKVLARPASPQGLRLIPPTYAIVSFTEQNLIPKNGRLNAAFRNHEIVTQTMRFNANFLLKNPRYQRMGSGKIFGNIWERMGNVLEAGLELAEEQGEFASYNSFSQNQRHFYGPAAMAALHSHQYSPWRFFLRKAQRPVQGIAWKEFSPDIKRLIKNIFLH
jgi:hypothetical protein